MPPLRLSSWEIFRFILRSYLVVFVALSSSEDNTELVVMQWMSCCITKTEHLIDLSLIFRVQSSEFRGFQF